MFVSEGSERVKTATLSFKLNYAGPSKIRSAEQGSPASRPSRKHPPSFTGLTPARLRCPVLRVAAAAPHAAATRFTPTAAAMLPAVAAEPRRLHHLRERAMLRR